MGYIRIYRGSELRKQLELGQETVSIGRTEDNTIVLPDEGISRQHAAIEYVDGDYFIVDLGSQNGVFLNKQKIEKQKLKYWDEIQIHNFVIKFMAKPGIGESKEKEIETPSELNSDKTKFFNLEDKKQLDELRKKTKECFLTYKDESGTTRNPLLKKPKVVFGKSKSADIKIGGWFAPKVAATIERQGSVYELVPSGRGKVTLDDESISKATKLVDGATFSVRGTEFKFYHRLTKTS